MLALAASILAPTARHTLAVVVTLNVVVIAPIFALFFVLALSYGQLRELRYLPLYFPFQMARRLAKFESTLSLPTRPSPFLLRRGGSPEAPGYARSEMQDARS
jgi:hypothetical protein